MKETVLKHDDTQHLLAEVQKDYASTTKNVLEKRIISLIKNKNVIKNEYFKRKRDVLS